MIGSLRWDSGARTERFVRFVPFVPFVFLLLMRPGAAEPRGGIAIPRSPGASRGLPQDDSLRAGHGRTVAFRSTNAARNANTRYSPIAVTAIA